MRKNNKDMKSKRRHNSERGRKRGRETEVQDIYNLQESKKRTECTRYVQKPLVKTFS